jgi:thymidylate kinase
MTIESKLRFAQQYSRLPFRDLYFFLDTPVETAMERIYKRISPMTIPRSLMEGTTGFIFMNIRNLFGHWIKNSG